ncbi:DUF881 domain-containing protein [Cellulomonas soli]
MPDDSTANRPAGEAAAAGGGGVDDVDVPVTGPSDEELGPVDLVERDAPGDDDPDDQDGLPATQTPNPEGSSEGSSEGIEQELARLARMLDPTTVVPLSPEDPDAPQDVVPAERSDPLEETPRGDLASSEPFPHDPARRAEIAAARAAGGREARSVAEGWRTLARGLRPRATKGQLLAGVLCAVLGFALVVQVRQTASVSLSSMRQEDLLRILDEATTRSDDLAREVTALERERDQLLSDDDTRQAARDAARRTAIAQGILTGRLPAQGPGVTATILDPEGTVKPVTLLNFMEELRNAGAEAIELNGQRVTASSAFTGSPGSVVLDGVTISPPYRWKAIGDPDTIAPALEMPGGAVATVRGNGGSASVDRQELVTIDALRSAPDPAYATPVPPEAG